jgi:hypothetical protein
MAIVAGSIVALRNIGPQYASGVQAQPPGFGVVQTLGTPPAIDVIWPDGHVEADMDLGQLDEILSADAASVTGFQGRFVRHTRAPSPNSDSPGFDGYVVQLYKRQIGGTGAATSDLALIRTQTGFWIEVPVGELEVVPGN